MQLITLYPVMSKLVALKIVAGSPQRILLTYYLYLFVKVQVDISFLIIQRFRALIRYSLVYSLITFSLGSPHNLKDLSWYIHLMPNKRVALKDCVKLYIIRDFSLSELTAYRKMMYNLFVEDRYTLYIFLTLYYLLRCTGFFVTL